MGRISNDVLAFNGMTALVVDQESMLTMELGLALRDAGCCNVLVSKTPADARGLLNPAARIDLAVLELASGSESAMPLARHLLRTGARIVFTGGSSRSTRRVPTVDGIPLVEKPYLVHSILALLAGAAQEQQPV